jgi:type VI secretion system protein ImpK
MASDNDDRTKLRIPGAAKPAPPPPPRAPAAPPPPPPPPAAAAAPPRAAAPPPPPRPDLGPAPGNFNASQFRIRGSFNPLLEAALPLLLLATRIRSTSEAPQVEVLQRRIAEEVQRFEATARESQVGQDDLTAARYALCTTLDEFVLNTPWGAHSAWATQPLLYLFHREGFGGEKFFQIIERISREPARYGNLLELMHACLGIGFEGRYRLDAQGPARLTEIQRDVYERLRAQRGPLPRELSVEWAGVTDNRPRLVRYVPLWVVATATLAVVLLSYIGFRAALSGATSPVNAALAAIGTEPMYVSSQPPPVGPRLVDLLAPEIRSQQLEVIENGARTTIRLLHTSELFASGSATVSADALPALRAIAAAVNKVPGRLMVVGHTDDQPVRSLKFGDNYELSRARAQAVADVLKPLLDRAAGIEAVGRGPDQPVATPVDRPENRARNRRVEIVHQAGL